MEIPDDYEVFPLREGDDIRQLITLVWLTWVENGINCDPRSGLVRWHNLNKLRGAIRWINESRHDYWGTGETYADPKMVRYVVLTLNS